MECVQIVNYTVMINGEKSEPFNAARGLRQGDRISHFLFAIAMEYLRKNLNEMKENKSFQFHPRWAKVGITHLGFADDLLLFSKGNANLGKSCVYIGGVKKEIQDNILSHLGFVHGTLPFKYLGVPLSTKKLILLQWQPLIEKITSRITSWSAKKLSYAGKTQLFKSVLFGIQAYWAQLFLIPEKVLKTIDAYCRSFVWSGSSIITRKALVAWDRDPPRPKQLQLARLVVPLVSEVLTPPAVEYGRQGYEYLPLPEPKPPEQGQCKQSISVLEPFEGVESQLAQLVPEMAPLTQLSGTCS
nr:uncharacterized protein LOC104107386 [Nicotiana tomentosiformis]